MRFLMNFKLPHEVFNKLVRDGIAGQKLGRVVEETRPEHIYFCEHDGYRVRRRDLRDWGNQDCARLRSRGF